MRRGCVVLAMIGVVPAAVAGTVIALFYAGGDYAVELANGYQLVRTNASTIMIWSPEGASRRCMVPPKITRIGWKDDLVYGQVETDPSSDPGFRQAEGFFVLNTRDGSVSIGLTKDEYLAALRELGIREEPRLARPSRSLNAGRRRQ
jgi:hypothetical protein